ncbi:MAG TPA: thiamine pyrophosphate-requiring protein [Alphaproteobacteria bacterium]|nr:thiamine pyrophosphate-requiring protein [Alphaproteobacteria bacterium]
MAQKSLKVESVAEAYLALLAERGVEYLFANAGTDFAPIVEALAKADAIGSPAPKPMIAVHENLAMSMAHGYAMVSGKVPAVMVHVSVGTANAICGALNAARENVPILFTAGRTPLTEEGLAGARDAYIHWGQEMYDQAGMLREVVKWDYELRNAEQLETVVDRALAIARSEPCGPVYLTLPREVLAAPLAEMRYQQPARRVAAASPRADEAALAEAAKILAAAENPLILTTSAGRDPTALPALAAIAERFAIPVVQFSPRHLSLPCDHPMQLGFNPTPLVAEADAVLVLESDVPWIPSRVSPPAHARVIHIGLDPLFQRYPIRGFLCDLAIPARVSSALNELLHLLESRCDKRIIERRRARIAERHAVLHGQWQALRDSVRGMLPIHPAWLSHCIEEVKGDDAIVVNEYTLMQEHCGFRRAGSFFGSSSASGLGWGLGAALGAKLAAPERLVIATLGDGAYLFANPVAGHHAARVHRLPILTIVFNNAMWNAVRRATLGMYPDGAAAKSNHPAFIHLEELPAFEAVCAAAGGYGERVEDPAELPAALGRALDAVTRERRQALLNVICQAPGGAI